MDVWPRDVSVHKFSRKILFVLVLEKPYAFISFGIAFDILLLEIALEKHTSNRWNISASLF
jgi:hypothetical protein